MKRLSMLLMLGALISVSAFAQTSRHQGISIKKNLGAAKPSLLGSSQRIEDCDTFVNLCVDDTLTIYTSTCDGVTKGGYVCGHNCYGDLAKADIFYLPGQTIKGLLIYFGQSTSANNNDTLSVRIWDNDGLFADGGTGAPGTALASYTKLKYNTVKTDVDNGFLTYIEFATPVTMPTDSLFYAGIEFTYQPNDTVAIVNVLDRTGSGLSCEDLNTAVDKWSDGSWHRFTDADNWLLATSQIILPITCTNACDITITPASATICKGKKVTLVASGATTYTWSPGTGLDVTTGTTVSAKPTSMTTYTVSGDGGACTETVTVTVKRSPPATFTQGPCSDGAILLTCDTPAMGVVTFKWLRDGVNIPGATNSTYSATITGSYKVKVTLTHTGCAKTSSSQTVSITCKMADDASQFTADAYPNPFVKSVSVNVSSSSTEAMTVKLTDFSGRTIREFKNVDPTAPFEINEDIAPGVYFVNVVQGKHEKMIKVVKTE